MGRLPMPALSLDERHDALVPGLYAIELQDNVLGISQILLFIAATRLYELADEALDKIDIARLGRHGRRYIAHHDGIVSRRSERCHLQFIVKPPVIVVNARPLVRRRIPAVR